MVPRERDLVALTVERAVRTAARTGNRLLAGNRARVMVVDDRLRSLLETTLARMGVRLVVEDDTGAEGCSTKPRHAEFVFVTSITPSQEPGDGAADGLPTTTIAMDGGTVAWRGAGAAARIAWAARGMQTTAHLARVLRSGGSSDPLNTHETALPPRVAVSLVLEPKTAAFALALADAGFEVALFSAVNETDPEVAQALAVDGRVAVFAPTTIAAPHAHVDSAVSEAIDAAHAIALLEWGPEYLIDDGAHIVRLAHTERPDALRTLKGAAEETTSGVRPLREMLAKGRLRIPVIAVNDARTKTDFDNLIGTGQSCVFAVADCLEDASGTEYRGISGSHWVVIGYGPVGVGVARFAAALGARVTVVERDPTRALAALHDGCEAGRLEQVLPHADVVISATGVWHSIGLADMALMRPGAAVAIAGGIDDELALDDARAAGWTQHAVTPQVTEWIAPDDQQGILVLAGGGGVNYSAGEGNPIEVMDLSFATQLAALSRLMHERLVPGVHVISPSDEHLVARVALDTRSGCAEPAPVGIRPGGAAQPWTVHRYRQHPMKPLDSSE